MPAARSSTTTMLADPSDPFDLAATADEATSATTPADLAAFTTRHTVLQEGFRLLLQFFIDEEAHYLSRVRGADPSTASAGSITRKILTPVGEIPLRVPHILYKYPRVSISKRATRLSLEILDNLARIHTAGLAPGETRLLIKTLWTSDLPDAQLDALTEKLTPLLDQWRAASARPAHTGLTHYPWACVTTP